MTYVANVVRTPIAGTVVALPAQIGMTVTGTSPIVRIAGAAALEIQLYVAERFISKIALNQRCDITLDAWPGEVFRGSVREISPIVDQASRTMTIKVNVDNPGKKLKAGMFAKVHVITDPKENVVKIPSGAMIQRFGETYVFSVGQGGAAATKTLVKPGITVDGVTEITEGLTVGQEIVVKGHQFLTEGAKINIIERVAPLGAR
jgi:RND family efflux transporter MFP subunit